VENQKNKKNYAPMIKEKLRPVEGVRDGGEEKNDPKGETTGGQVTFVFQITNSAMGQLDLKSSLGGGVGYTFPTKRKNRAKGA